MSAKERALKARMDDKLDEALQDSFPASDPIAFIEPQPVSEGDLKLPEVAAAGRPRKRKKAG